LPLTLPAAATVAALAVVALDPAVGVGLVEAEL
jgi:hypothetical protein